MGKFGCRLCCWGCGGCCLITGIVVGVLSAVVPPSMVASLQEGLFDLAYIDDTSQSEAEGLLADGGLPIAESDAFKAWGKSMADGFDDCMKEDFPFDWAKSPEDCVDGLHKANQLYNVTNPDTWGDGNALEVQEVGSFVFHADLQKIEPDTSYWDETGKARFRIKEMFKNSYKCYQSCEKFSNKGSILTLSVWYGLLAGLMLGDGWLVAHAATALDDGSYPATLKAYLDATAPYPMDPNSAIPFLPTRTVARMIDFVTFLYTPDAPKLGAIDLQQNVGTSEYASLRSFLWDLGGTLITNAAPAFGAPARVVPILLKATANNIFGWGEIPAYADPISWSPFTFNSVGGISANEVIHGAVPEAFVETKMSSVYYHEGLGYFTQHYEMFGQPSTNNHSCAWDPDCAPGCFPTDTCKPQAASGHDAGKIPGLYFGSPKGTPGFAEFNYFYATFYWVFAMKTAGKVVLPVKYKGPNAEENTWDFEGFLAHSVFKAASFTRRLENCAGAVTLESGATDSPGIDCNFVKDTSPVMPFYGLPVYWILLVRDSPGPGWDPALANTDDGKSITIQKQIKRTSCEGNEFCTDAWVDARGPAFTTLMQLGYEPHLGALVDVHCVGGMAWKLVPTPRHAHLFTEEGYTLMPLFWFHVYLHLPSAVNMALSKLQGVPAALNGFYILLVGQCMISLIGGFACCFCGV